MGTFLKFVLVINVILVVIGILPIGMLLEVPLAIIIWYTD
jgi:hypothetical protein